MNAALLERKRRLASNPQDRLKWRILWGFGVLPTEQRARDLDDDAIIDCALHMVLDGEKRPAVVENPSFDMEKFIAQGGGDDGTE